MSVSMPSVLVPTGPAATLDLVLVAKGRRHRAELAERPGRFRFLPFEPPEHE
jgi:hypothetical protein